MLLLRVHALKFKSLFELLLCDVKNGALRKAVGANSPIGCGSLGRRGRGWGGASVVVDAVVSPETSGVAAGEAGAHFSSSPRRVALAFLKQHNTLKLIVTDVLARYLHHCRLWRCDPRRRGIFRPTLVSSTNRLIKNLF